MSSKSKLAGALNLLPASDVESPNTTICENVLDHESSYCECVPLCIPRLGRHLDGYNTYWHIDAEGIGQPPRQQQKSSFNIFHLCTGEDQVHIYPVPAMHDGKKKHVYFLS